MTTRAVDHNQSELHKSLLPHLLITAGPQKGTLIGLDFERLATRPLVLGRQAGEAEVVLVSRENRVSRRHIALSFRAEDELLLLADAGSSNGTAINGEMIAGLTPLFPGDRISCGDVDLVVVVPILGMGLPVGGLPGQTGRRYLEDSQPGVARLEVVATQVPGLKAGAFCRLTPAHPFVIGRNKSNDLPLIEADERAALKVSRRHAEIRWAGESYLIRDLGAANPAYVNQKPLDTPLALADGDPLQIGTTLLRYRAPRLPLLLESHLQEIQVEATVAFLRLTGRRSLESGPALVRLPTDRQILIGRAEDNDLRLDDRSISRRHARLLNEGGRWFLADLGSANGTRLNESLISGTSALKAGDRLKIGEFEFGLEIGSTLTTSSELSQVAELCEPVTLRLGQADSTLGSNQAEVEGSSPPARTETTEPLVHPLRSVAPFDDLDSVTFRLLAPYFKEVHYKPGQEIVREGQGRGAFLAILEGRVSVSRALSERQRLVLGELEAGSVYGERSILADQPFANRLEALTTVRLLRLEENVFLRELRSNRSVVTFFEEQVGAAGATNWMRATLLMRTLSDRTRHEMAKRLRFRVYEPGETLAEQGQAADEFFLMRGGLARAYVPDAKGRENLLATLEEGDTFGDGIAAPGETYPMTVRAERVVECYVLTRADFESVLAKSGDPVASLGTGLGGLPLGAVLNRVGPFMLMPPQLVAKIAAQMKSKFFKQGETILVQDEPASAFYIIRSGAVEMTFKTREGEERSTASLGPGQFFGEASLLTNTDRTDTVRATEDCELLALYRNRLEAVLKLGESYDLGQYFAKGLNKRFRPMQVSGVRVTEHTAATGEHYYLLSRDASEGFFKLSERSLFLWNLMDGDNSLNDLSLAYFVEFSKLDLEGASNLVGQLQAAGYLQVPPIDQSLVSQAAPRRGPFFRLLNWRYEFKRVDRLFDRLYNWGGQVFFWPPVVGLLALVVLAGFGSFLFYGLFDPQAGTGLLNIVQGAGLGAFTVPGALPWYTLLGVLLLNFMLHEAAHGLACKAYGRRVLSGGFGLQYGGPVFFVNTNEIWLEKRGPRIVVNLAGPLANAVFGGACCLLILLTSQPEMRTALFQMAAVAYTLVYININPLLELDGYFALMDWLEIPGLRRKALTFVRHKLSGQPIRRPPPRREQRIYWWYVGLTPVYLVFTVVQFSFFLGGLLSSLGLSGLLKRMGLGQGWADTLVLALTLVIVVVLALPVFGEFWRLGREEDELATPLTRRRRNRR